MQFLLLSYLVNMFVHVKNWKWILFHFMNYPSCYNLLSDDLDLYSEVILSNLVSS